MRLQPNLSLIDAEVHAVRRCADGLGADLDLAVLHCAPAPGARDFIGASPGEVLVAYTAVPEAVRPGQRVRLEASVLGGPQGERIVVQRVGPMPTP